MSTQPEGPDEQELRAAYEAELNRITTTEMILQTAVSLVNIGARRVGLTGAGEGAEGQDLEQARDAIDAVGSLLEILDRRAPNEARQLRDALSQLQIAYARQAPAGAAVGEGDRPVEPAPGSATPTQSPGSSDEGGKGPGPAESSGRLWVPGR